MWKNNADKLSPLDFGWTISDNKFDIKWFDGDQYPTNIADVTSVDTVDDEDDDDSLPVSYTHLRAHETLRHLVCRLLLEKKK